MDGFQLLQCIKWLRFWICRRCECMKLRLSTPCSTGAAIVIVFECVQSTSVWQLIKICTVYKIKHINFVTLWELTWCRTNTETAKYMFKSNHQNTRQSYTVLVYTQQIIWKYQQIQIQYLSYHVLRMTAIAGFPVEADVLHDKGVMPRDLIRKTLCLLQWC